MRRPIVLIRIRPSHIHAQYEKMRKGAEVAHKIAQSTLTSRLLPNLLHRRGGPLLLVARGFLQVFEPSVPMHARTSKKLGGRDMMFDVDGP
ncbi:hypothetical protein C8R43DRAFT_1123033 [Mycena crocata]|nr:hypothetical protein C8R43DRAFT_1123033 [Mycena crocata]